jgi:anti-sigma B factor antagonist
VASPFPLDELTVEDRDEVTLARVSGEVDLSNADRLATRLREAYPGGRGGLVLDLTAVEYLDSSALRMLIDTQRALSPEGERRLAIVVSEGSFVADLFETVRAEDIFAVHRTVEDAAAALGRID